MRKAYLSLFAALLIAGEADAQPGPGPVPGVSAVTAGTGLAGGGSSGNVTVSLADVLTISDCDGSTDISVEFNLYETMLNVSGGGTIQVQNTGLACRATFTQLSNVSLIGVGLPTIKAPDGVNKTVIEGLNFQSLTGTDSGTAGISNFQIRNLIIDGNSGINTSPGSLAGHGIAFVGRSFVIDNVTIQNTYRTGLWDEYASGATRGTSPYDGHVSRLTVLRAGENCWYNDVSDLHVNDVNASTCSTNADNTFDGIKLDTHGSVRGSNINVWSTGVSAAALPKYSLEESSGAVTLTNLHLEMGRTENLFLAGSHDTIAGANLYNNGNGESYLAAITGAADNVQIHAYPVSGSTAVTALQLGQSGHAAVGNVIQLNTYNTLNGVVDQTFSGGDNLITGVANQPSGPIFVGSAIASDNFCLSYSGTVSVLGCNFPTGVSSTNFGAMGAFSMPDWGTSGLGFTDDTTIVTNTTASGTIANEYWDKLGGKHIAASSPVTFTTYYGLDVEPVVASTNVTIVNNQALRVHGGAFISGDAVEAGNFNIQGNLTYGGVSLAQSVTGTGSMVLSTSPVLVTPSIGVASGTSLTLTGQGAFNSLALSGNISLPSPTVNGFGITGSSATYTDTTGTGTIAVETAFGLPVITLNSTSALTVTDFSELYLPAPLCTGNATCTNKDSLYAAGRIRGVLGAYLSGAAVQLNVNSNNATTINTGTSTGAVTIGGSSNTVNLPGIASSSAAQTGTVCWTTATGNLTVDTTTTCLLSLEETKNIKASIDPLEAMKEEMKLDPFWFSYKPGGAQTDFRVHAGLGAHAVEKVDPRLVGYDPKGKLTGVRYADSITSLNVAAIKGLITEVASLKAANDNLTSRIAKMERR